jgi:hypothetical protein
MASSGASGTASAHRADTPSAAPISAPASAPAPSSAARQIASAVIGRWERALPHAVVSIGVGDKRVAVLGARGEVWMLEGDAWIDLALPDRLRPANGERDDLRVFFGRDDRPRIMGTRHGPSGARGIYLRWKGNWRDKPGEIGRLEGPPEAAFFGLLGHADPEVVCKLGDICIIKRLTGWTMIPVTRGSMIVELAGDKGAAGAGTHGAYRVDKAAWRPLPGHGWQSAPGGIGGDDAILWVSEPSANMLHHHDGQRWSKHPSPLGQPRAVWAARADDVWLAGGDGIAHHDGKAWRRVAGPEGAFVDVRAAGDSVWAAGPAGVWRGRR